MDVFDELREKIDEMESRTKSPPLTLGGIIDALENIDPEILADAYITFDWGNAWPVGFDSYRGDYSQLCLQYTGDYSGHIKGAKFLEICKQTLGRVFEGWKGGDYVADASRDVWVACRGMTSNTRVVGIRAGADKWSGITVVTEQSERY